MHTLLFTTRIITAAINAPNANISLFCSAPFIHFSPGHFTSLHYSFAGWLFRLAFSMTGIPARAPVAFNYCGSRYCFHGFIPLFNSRVSMRSSSSAEFLSLLTHPSQHLSTEIPVSHVQSQSSLFLTNFDRIGWKIGHFDSGASRFHFFQFVNLARVEKMSNF